MYVLRLTIEGATEDEMKKGIDAAKAVFDKAGVHPAIAADGWWAMQEWDEGGFAYPLSEEDHRNGDIWLEAEKAAVNACCDGWEANHKPYLGALELVNTEGINKRREEDGTWTVYNTFTGEPVATVGGGKLTGLDEHEAEDALDLLDEGVIEVKREPTVQ